jgi:hypothetical protein
MFELAYFVIKFPVHYIWESQTYSSRKFYTIPYAALTQPTFFSWRVGVRSLSDIECPF